MSDYAGRISDLPPEKLRLLLQQLKKKKGEGTAPTNIGRQPRDSDTFVLSFAQQRLWLLEQFEPGNTSYNLSTAFRLKGALKVDALEQSVNAILARHEILRTVFRSVGGEPMQVISQPRPLSLSVTDLRALSPEDREAEVRRMAALEAVRPFYLSLGPLLRVALIRSGDSEHVLLLTIHHIIFDAWSMNVFIRELCLLYDSFSAGRPSPLPELPVQYADYAVWQRRRLKGELLESQLAYWKRQLGDAAGALELPLDRPRPKNQTHGGAHENLSLPKPLSAALRALGEAQGATLFMTLLAAFQLLMHRYTGQAEINVGTPMAGRGRRELEDLIGFFINTLVIKTSFDDDPSFRQLLTRVRQTTLEAFTHQDVPFEKIVEELHPKRDLSRPPLFQVMFQLKNLRVEVPTRADLDVSLIEVEKGRAQFDLTLELAEMEDGLVGIAEYNKGLFEAETIRRMLRHYRTLLEAAASDPDRPVSELRLLSEEEERRQLEEWCGAEAKYEWAGGVAAEVARRARERGERVAVECGDRAVTYAELNGQANRLASYLKRLGVSRESRVGLYGERSVETCIALLAILKAGGAYVPLDPTYPRERLAFMAKDAGPAVVLVGAGLDGAALDCPSKLVSLEADWDAAMREEDDDSPCEATPDDAAYVIYTSGSTGTPKGVVGLHGGVINRVKWMQELYPFGADEVCCQKTSLSFVDSVWETLGPLMLGAKLVVIPDEAVKDARRLVRVLGESGAARVVLVPSLLRAVLDAHHDLRASLPQLKYCVCSGEALPVELARRFGAAMPHAKLINIYGSSEVAADATWHEAKGGDALTRVPIGRPIANTQAYILDSRLRPLPVGVTGELHVGGDGLARGYLGAPALTAGKFIPNPFGGRGSRLYKTGDLARRLPDGAIEYVGRNDRQVKLRGFRIELGEVEVALEQHPSVREAVVLAGRGATGETRLTAYVLPRPGEEVTAAALRAFSRKKLPEYMAPASFVLLDSMPLTPSGKVDRRSLSLRDEAGRRAESDDDAPPRTPAEETLAGIWRELLKAERVGIHDNFFELGGHSLLATQVVTQVRDAFKVDLPQRVLFDAPTIAELADVLAQSRRGPGGDELEDILKEVEALTAGEAEDALSHEADEG